jgi:hypothetical protein
MIAREHDCWFSAEHAAKDSGIAQALAAEAGLKLPVNDATKAQYDRMTAEGLGGLDKSGIAELTFPGRHANPAGREAPGRMPRPRNQAPDLQYRGHKKPRTCCPGFLRYGPGDGAGARPTRRVSRGWDGNFNLR